MKEIKQVRNDKKIRKIILKKNIKLKKTKKQKERKRD